MITRCYLEITNICNLDCVFCPKTERRKQSLTLQQFDALTDSLQGKIRFLYFHLMGEPLLHPLLPQFVSIARAKGFVPVLTTNGTLLPRAGTLLDARPHKVQISLQAFEGNRKENLEEYMTGVMRFAVEAASRGVVVVLRLWNIGGCDSANDDIRNFISRYLPVGQWEQRHYGWRLAENVYLEYDGVFEWPDAEREEFPDEECFCYALRNQIGVLVDGTVVPCCLDHAGDIPLGNLYEQSLDDILSSERARNIYDGFTRHKAVEPLCRRCGYAAVAKRFRKK